MIYRLLLLSIISVFSLQCASVPEKLKTEAKSQSLTIGIASVEDLGRSYTTDVGTYTTKDPSVHYVQYQVVFKNESSAPVAVSLMQFIGEPLMEATLDGEPGKLPPSAKGFDPCCGLSAFWFDIANGTSISSGNGSGNHYRELEPGQSVAVYVVFMVPANERHSVSNYSLDDKDIERLKEMELNDIFSSPEAPYLKTSLQVPVPQD